MTKSNKLVYEFDMPENGVCCIYKLICNKEGVVYVGQSERLKERIKQHARQGKEFDSFDYYECDKEFSNEVECAEIIKHNPSLNTMLPKTDNHITLRQLRLLLTEAFNGRVDEIIRTIPYSFDRGGMTKSNYSYVSTVISKELVCMINKVTIEGNGELYTNVTNKISNGDIK